MIKGKDNILQWFDMCKAPYWKLCDAGNKNTVRAASEGLMVEKGGDDDLQVANASLSIQESRQQLMDYLNVFAPGRYLLRVSSSAKGGATWKETQIDTTDGGTAHVGAVASPQMPMAGWVTAADVEKRIEEAKKGWDLERTLNDLKQQIKDMKSGVHGTDPNVNRVISALEPYIPYIFGLDPKAATQVAVSGFKKDQANADPEKAADVQSRFEAATESLSEGHAPEEFVAILEALANLKKNEPGKYAMALTMLK